jgi:hypothetical protein
VCSNKDLEITCASGKCESNSSFTSSSVSLNTRTRDLSICMYSMCIEGKADQLLANRNYVIARGDRLKSNTGNATPRERRSGVIVIDVAEKSGAFIAMNFRTPVICEVR